MRASQAHGVPGLEPRSRRPKRVRQSSTPPEVVARIQALRAQEPRWGREKLRVLLAREEIQVSAKRKAQRAVLRRPKELVVGAPGGLVQLDTKEVPLGRGWTVEEFAAADGCTRKRVVALASALTAWNAIYTRRSAT